MGCFERPFLWFTDYFTRKVECSDKYDTAGAGRHTRRDKSRCLRREGRRESQCFAFKVFFNGFCGRALLEGRAQTKRKMFLQTKLCFVAKYIALGMGSKERAYIIEESGECNENWVHSDICSDPEFGPAVGDNEAAGDRGSVCVPGYSVRERF